MDVFHTKLPTSGAASNNYCFFAAKSYGLMPHAGTHGNFFGFHSEFQVIGEILWVERFKFLGVNSVKTPVIQDVATRTFVSQSRFFQLHKLHWPTGGVDPT